MRKEVIFDLGIVACTCSVSTRETEAEGSLEPRNQANLGNPVRPHLKKSQTLNIQKKKRKLKAAREKHQVTHKGKSIRIVAHFSTKTLNIRRAWKNVFQIE